MVTPGRVLWDTLRDAYDSASEIVVANVLWFLLTILVITAPAALAGAYYSAFSLAQHKPGGASNFFKGMRRYAWAGYRFFLIHLIILTGMYFNFVFYGRFNTLWATWVQGIFIGLFVIWLGLNIFTFPLYMAQIEKKFLITLRNSLVFYLKMPVMCVSLFLFLLVITAISTLLGVPWLLFSTILIMMLSCRFTLLIITKLGFQTEENRYPYVESD